MSTSTRILLPVIVLALGTATTADAISRHPTGVNVNSQGATSVFITFGDLDEQVPVEATWCGELIPATPDVGFKCDSSTLFGRLPIRFDQSRLTGNGSIFTDIMSIPPSVARRAYQAAERGETSSFFYVRRFVSLVGGPDEYVFVTCRLTGGGARVPLALLDVELAFEPEATVLSVPTGSVPPPFSATLTYNGTGRLRGRWEVIQPGDEPPDSRDLLTEATLPPEERPLQRRYSLLERFDVYLPPTGRIELPGPDPSRLPNEVDGLYQVLLRIEASDDKEADSDRAAAGAAGGVIHAGAVAGFPLPTLRYFVGTATEGELAGAEGDLRLLAPAEGTAEPPVRFAWTLMENVLTYRLEVEREEDGETVLAAVLQQGIGTYAAPPWLEGEGLRWRVVARGPGGDSVASTPWRSLDVAAPAEADEPPGEDGEDPFRQLPDEPTS